MIDQLEEFELELLQLEEKKLINRVKEFIKTRYLTIFNVTIYTFIILNQIFKK